MPFGLMDSVAVAGLARHCGSYEVSPDLVAGVDAIFQPQDVAECHHMKLGIRSLIVTTAMTLGACSGKTADTNSALANTANMAAASPAGTAASADNAMHYPDWAKAVAPPYPNVLFGMMLNSALYQFQSTDDPATVADWYKSHVSAPWNKDATSDSWGAVVNGVGISVGKISGPPGGPGSAQTMIHLSRL